MLLDVAQSCISGEKNPNFPAKKFPRLNTNGQQDFEVSKFINLELNPLQNNNFVHDSEYAQDIYADGMDEVNNENQWSVGYQDLIQRGSELACWNQTIIIC